MRGTIVGYVQVRESVALTWSPTTVIEGCVSELPIIVIRGFQTGGSWKDLFWLVFHFSGRLELFHVFFKYLVLPLLLE